MSERQWQGGWVEHEGTLVSQTTRGAAVMLAVRVEDGAAPHQVLVRAVCADVGAPVACGCLAWRWCVADPRAAAFLTSHGAPAAFDGLASEEGARDVAASLAYAALVAGTAADLADVEQRREGEDRWTPLLVDGESMMTTGAVSLARINAARVRAH